MRRHLSINRSMCEDGAPGEDPEPDVIGENPSIEHLEAILGEYARRSILAPEVVKRIDSTLRQEIGISKESKRPLSIALGPSQELNEMVALRNNQPPQTDGGGQTIDPCLEMEVGQHLVGPGVHARSTTMPMKSN